MYSVVVSREDLVDVSGIVSIVVSVNDSVVASGKCSVVDAGMDLFVMIAVGSVVVVAIVIDVAFEGKNVPPMLKC